jgi:phosphoserine phosphatase RsbU/P
MERPEAVDQPPLNILLVEDDQDHADLIRMHLTRGRGEPVSIDWARDMAQARQRLDAGGYDAVLLDMMLPDSRGIDTVSRVHSHAPRVPIVVLTSAEDDEFGIGAVQHGAEDYIAKSTMDGHSLLRSLRYAIEREGRRRAESALESARYELSLAQKIQSSLYPSQSPPLPGFDLAGRSRPAASVGGDYFDYIPMPAG